MPALVGCMTQEPEVLVRYLVHPYTFVSPSPYSRRAVVSYCGKYVHEVLVNCLAGLSLPRKSVVRLTDHPNMTINVYCRRKTTIQQKKSMQQYNKYPCLQKFGSLQDRKSYVF